MTSPKLAIADKQEILRLYCETDLSTAKLSKQFGISTSTTLRLLQEMMSPEAYKKAVQKKQSKPKSKIKTEKQIKSTKSDTAQLGLELLDSNLYIPEDAIAYLDIDDRDSSSHEIEETEELSTTFSNIDTYDDTELEFDEDQQSVVEDLVSELVGEDIIDDDDEFDEDDEVDAEDDESEDDQSALIVNLESVSSVLKILPLDQAELSNICYIVVDKASEIVTRPMRDFKELGKVPTEEINLQALPVFDNHRAARRFSTPNQKVIKFPGSLIYATKSHLSRKGITRLLYGGQIFAL